jgi:type II secretion system protein N
MAELRDVLNRDFWRAHATEAAYAGAAAALFAIFLIATFPYSDAVSGVLAPAGLALKSADQRVSFPFGAELDDVRLVSLTSPGAPLLQSERIKVTPALGSLLWFHPGVNATADLSGGVVRVSAHRGGDGTHVAFDLAALNLAQSRGLSAIGASLAGMLSGSGELVLASDDSDSQSGDIALRAAGMNLRVGPGMPAISFGDVNAKLKLAGAALTLEELKSSGGDVALDGHGTIRPAADWRQSPINLTVRMQLSAEAQSRLQFLVAMLPHPPGDQPYQIGGTLGSPIFLGAGHMIAPRIESASVAPAATDRDTRLQQWRERMEQRRAERTAQRLSRGDRSQRHGFGRQNLIRRPPRLGAANRPLQVPAAPQISSGDNSSSGDDSSMQDKDEDSDSSDSSDNNDN